MSCDQRGLDVAPSITHSSRTIRVVVVVHCDMDAPTADALNAPPHNDPPQSPDRIPIAAVARRRMMKARVVGSPVRRSPRLSCLPPPQSPSRPQDAQDLNERSDDESESVNDVALHLFRDETPENDDFPPDGERQMYPSIFLSLSFPRRTFYDTCEQDYTSTRQPFTSPAGRCTPWYQLRSWERRPIPVARCIRAPEHISSHKPFGTP